MKMGSVIVENGKKVLTISKCFAGGHLRFVNGEWRDDNGDAIEISRVRHGRWEKQRGIHSCSECGMTCPYDVQADVIEYWTCNYCPKCGAKMDLEE